MQYMIRDFETHDGEAVNELALSAFEQYKNYYNDWEKLSSTLSNMSSLANHAELIVAITDDTLIGAVAYVPPYVEKKLFPKEWPVIRMLVVDPNFRKFGVGKRLIEECICRAVRDKSPLIALHTSSIMKVALKIYLRMGFIFHREAPALYGVPYNIYIKKL